MQNKKHFQYQGVEYSQFKTLRLLSALLYGLFGVILILSMWFLYTRMYQTIGQVEAISALSPTLSVNVLQIEQYDDVTTQLDARSTASLPVLMRDPFNSYEVFQRYVASTTNATMEEVSSTTAIFPSTSSLQ